MDVIMDDHQRNVDIDTSRPSSCDISEQVSSCPEGPDNIHTQEGDTGKEFGHRRESGNHVILSSNAGSSQRDSVASSAEINGNASSYYSDTDNSNLLGFDIAMNIIQREISVEDDCVVANMDTTTNHTEDVLQSLDLIQTLEDKTFTVLGEKHQESATSSSTIQLTDHNKKMHKQQKAFKCDVCGQRFVGKKGLFYHHRIHAIGQKQSQCDICKKVFRHSSLLKLHIRSHAIKKHECKVCHMRFKTATAYDNHFLLHNAGKSFSCSYCSERFVTRKGLINHCKNSHFGKKPYPCLYCHKAYLNRTSYKTHLWIDHPRIKCSVCQEMFRDKLSLVAHKRSHPADVRAAHIRNFHDEEDIVLPQCSVCKKLFVSKAKRKEHLLTNTCAEYSKWVCAICGEQFSEYLNLQGHMEKKHKQNQENDTVTLTHECCVCGYAFLNKRKMTVHINSSHLGNCQVCNRIFHKVDDFRTHMKTFHNIEHPFRCELCDATFENGSAMIKHDAHGKLYECGECHKILSCKSVLDMHLKVHQDDQQLMTKFRRMRGTKVSPSRRLRFLLAKLEAETDGNNIDVQTVANPEVDSSSTDSNENLQGHLKKKHKHNQENDTVTLTHECCVCGYAFLNKRKLTDHINSAHLGNCQVCNRIFHKVDDFRTHMKTFHNIENPFRCELCDATFENGSAMIKHDVHGKLYECGECHKTLSCKYVLDMHLKVHQDDQQLMTKVRGMQGTQVRLSKRLRFFLAKLEVETDRNNIGVKTVVNHEVDSSSDADENYRSDLGTDCEEIKNSMDFQDADPSVDNIQRNVCTTSPPRAEEVDDDWVQLQCNVSGEDFSSKTTLQNVKHSTVCDVCDWDWEYNDINACHQQIYKYNKDQEAAQRAPLRCILCLKTFSNQNMFHQHLQCHVACRNLQCDVCNETFYMHRKIQDDFQGLVGASKKFANQVEHIFDIDKYTCYLCSQIVESSCLQQHFSVKHQHLKSNHCIECDKVFINDITLNEHMKSHSKNIGSQPDSSDLQTTEDVAFQCSVCKDIFSTKGDIQIHMMCHVVIIIKPNKAPCEQPALSSENVLPNTATVNPLINPNEENLTENSPVHICICSREFSGISHLNDHILLYHKDDFDGSLLHCNMCKKQLNSPSEIKYHLQAYHNMSETYQCKMCEASFPSFCELFLHQKEHLVEKKCPICKDKFWLEDLFQSHVLAHEDHHRSALQLEMAAPVLVKGKATGLPQGGDVDTSNTQKADACEMESEDGEGNMDVAPQRDDDHKKSDDPESKSNTECLSESLSAPSGESNIDDSKSSAADTISAAEDLMGTCQLCFKNILRKDLAAHYRSHMGEKRFHCYICEKTFTSAVNLKSHQHLHNNMQKINCDICGYGMNFNMSQDHWISHYTEFRCRLCPKVNSTHLQLQTHMKSKHPNQAIHKCSICKHSTNQLKAHIAHGEVHGIKCVCGICGNAFYDEQWYTWHMECHKSGLWEDNIRTYGQIERVNSGHAIPDDRVSARSATSSDAHPSSNTLSGAITIKCEHCTLTFNEQEMYRHLHVHDIFQSSKIIKCRYCDITFLNNLHRYRHEHLHPGPHHKCKICKMVITGDIFSLHMHIQSHYDGTIWKCRICQMHTLSNRGLSKHFRTTHPSDLLFACDTCDSKQVTFYNLIIHKNKYHSNLYHCSKCPDVFPDHQWLEFHLRYHERKGWFEGVDHQDVSSVPLSDITSAECRNTRHKEASEFNRHGGGPHGGTSTAEEHLSSDGDDGKDDEFSEGSDLDEGGGLSEGSEGDEFSEGDELSDDTSHDDKSVMDDEQSEGPFPLYYMKEDVIKDSAERGLKQKDGNMQNTEKSSASPTGFHSASAQPFQVGQMAPFAYAMPSTSIGHEKIEYTEDSIKMNDNSSNNTSQLPAKDTSNSFQSSYQYGHQRILSRLTNESCLHERSVSLPVEYRIEKESIEEMNVGPSENTSLPVFVSSSPKPAMDIVDAGDLYIPDNLAGWSHQRVLPSDCKQEVGRSNRPSRTHTTSSPVVSLSHQDCLGRDVQTMLPASYYHHKLQSVPASALQKSVQTELILKTESTDRGPCKHQSVDHQLQKDVNGDTGLVEPRNIKDNETLHRTAVKVEDSHGQQHNIRKMEQPKRELSPTSQIKKLLNAQILETRVALLQKTAQQ